MFMFGRGFGVEETSQYIRNLKMENMKLRNDLQLQSAEDNNEELKLHMRWINEFNKMCKENKDEH